MTSLEHGIISVHVVPDGPPMNPTVGELGPTSLELSWLPPDITEQNGILQDYVVSYNFKGSYIELNTSETSIILEDLEEFTIYVITVNASTRIGVGPGASVRATTLSTGTNF